MSTRSTLSVRGFCCLMIGMPVVFLVAFMEGMAGPLHGISSLLSQGDAGSSGAITESLINWLIEA